MEDLKKERLKLIVRNLKSLVDALESEVHSDATNLSRTLPATPTIESAIPNTISLLPLKLYPSHLSESGV